MHSRSASFSLSRYLFHAISGARDSFTIDEREFRLFHGHTVRRSQSYAVYGVILLHTARYCLISRTLLLTSSAIEWFSVSIDKFINITLLRWEKIGFSKIKLLLFSCRRLPSRAYDGDDFLRWWKIAFDDTDDFDKKDIFRMDGLVDIAILARCFALRASHYAFLET